jgi:excisionase family DNA binding protein
MQVPNAEDQPTLSVDETAHILRIGRSGCYEAIARGQIPAVRFGRRIRVPTAALRQLLGMEIAESPRDAA